MRTLPAKLRALLAIFLLSLAPSCTHGLNAGTDGGIAFIFLTIMLLIAAVVLWYILDREG